MHPKPWKSLFFIIVLFSGGVHLVFALPENSPFQEILFDSVELFPAGQSSLILQQEFEKNTIYYFYLESFIPFADNVILDIYLTSPTGRQYHLFNRQADIEKNQTKIYFDHGVAEDGNYTVHYLVNTDDNLNLHILLKKKMEISLYYQKFSSNIDQSMDFKIVDIHQFGANCKSRTYTFSMRDDTEYMVNFFRVNPIAESDLEGKIVPEISMTLTLNESSFVYYPDIVVTDYVLFNNLKYSLEFLNYLPSLNNATLKIRFGAHCSGKATIELNFNQFWPFDANFAFIAYEVGSIGDGPDQPIPINQENTTNSQEENSTTLPDTNQSGHQDQNLTFDEYITLQYLKLTSFCKNNFWLLAFISVVAISILSAVSFYFQMQKEHETKFGYKRET